MKQYDNILKQTDVEKMIDDYFDCRLSISQENQLRELLISGRYSSEKIDDAISVMGIGAILRNNKRRIDRRLRSQRLIQTAAGIAIIATAALAIFYPSKNDTAGEYYCYHNGNVSNDIDDAENFFLSQLSDASEGAEQSDENIESAFLEFQDIDL